MALEFISAVPATVAWDSTGAHLTRIRFADRELRVARLRALRDERAAFPAGTSPRLKLVVEAESGDLVELVFDSSRRRWFVDALEIAA